MVKLNFNLAAFSFQRGVAILAKSFASAIVALNADVQNAKDEAFGYQQSLEQGGEWIGETDDDGTVIWDQSQILDYEVEVVNEAAQELRKAFALALYHHWERSARLWTQADNWSHEQLVAASLKRGYSACLDAKLIQTMREFGEEELADLREREPARYDALREEGRRSVFEKENRHTALTTLIDYYEQEAEAAGNAGAYLAGCLMWGAAAEGRLLLWCLRAPALAEQARQALPSKSRPKKPDPAGWTLDGLVQVAHGAGWIGVLEDDDFVFVVEGLLQNLRQSRNLIHPGRSLQLEPHLRRDKTAFDDAKAAYAVLRMNEVAHAPQEPNDLPP